MVARSRLLERFVEHHAINLNALSEESKVTASVAQYVLRLFNTRKGSVIVDGNYGVPSIDLNTNSDMQVFLKELESQLQAYDPRINSCRLSVLKNKNVQVFMRLLMKLKVSPVSSYEEEPMTIDFFGKFMVDGTFCFDDELI